MRNEVASLDSLEKHLDQHKQVNKFEVSLNCKKFHYLNEFKLQLIHTFWNITLMLQWIQQSFRNTSEDNVNSRLAYILHDDLCSSFEGDTLLAIRAPPHTHLEVPIPEDDQVRMCTKCLRILMSSN